ncbi:unnamed protein product [Prorocentrum cordatum]|uniref:Protein kinase domain-containing protein n=1 Tax=Prorocentrum cordatum TaxID=2364126 RepID=A0ABN9RBD4_9DINO|nr:unnamed protein product [Polarella glacialis]
MLSHGEATYFTWARTPAPASSASVPLLGSPSWRNHLHTGGAPSPRTARGQVVSVATPRTSVRATVGVHRLTSQPSSASGFGRDDGRDRAQALGAAPSGADGAALPPELLGGTSAYPGLHRCRSSGTNLSARAIQPTPRGESQALLPTSTRRSADVEVSEGGSDMQLRVRILPSELFKWKELQICACIDKASFGEVMLAKLGNDVLSAKRCHVGADGSMTKEQLHNFEREINAYRILKHPGVVGYVGCVLEPPNLAILTEYLPKGNIFNLLYMNRVNLPAAIRLRISLQLTEVVDFMHGLDPVLAHLDLKTPNILLDSEYNAKLCDFGKTQSLENGSSVVQGSELLGSPRYMAPELFHGPGSRFTEKADIWGMACCLIEILGGPIPFEDIPEVAQIVDCLRRELPPLVPHWFAEAVQPALRQCFAFVPAGRPTAAQLTVSLCSLTAHDMEVRGMDKRRAS